MPPRQVIGWDGIALFLVYKSMFKHENVEYKNLDKIHHAVKCYESMLQDPSKSGSHHFMTNSSVYKRAISLSNWPKVKKVSLSALCSYKILKLKREKWHPLIISDNLTEVWPFCNRWTSLGSSDINKNLHLSHKA